MRGRPVSEELPKSLPKLKELLEAREKQLKSMAEVLGEFNIRITDVQLLRFYHVCIHSSVQLASGEECLLQKKQRRTCTKHKEQSKAIYLLNYLNFVDQSDQLLKEMKENMEMTHRITDLEKKISMLKKKVINSEKFLLLISSLLAGNE